MMSRTHNAPKLSRKANQIAVKMLPEGAITPHARKPSVFFSSSDQTIIVKHSYQN